MISFKVGDRVICVDSNNCANYLKLHETYIVTTVNFIDSICYINVGFSDANGWKASRFIKVPKKLGKNDISVLIDALNV